MRGAIGFAAVLRHRAYPVPSREQERYAAAEPVARESLTIHRRLFPPDSWKTAKTASILGASLAGLGRYAAAETLLLDSYPLISDDRGPNHRRTRQAVERIVMLYERWNRASDAAHYRQILTSMDQGPPD